MYRRNFTDTVIPMERNSDNVQYQQKGRTITTCTDDSHVFSTCITYVNLHKYETKKDISVSDLQPINCHTITIQRSSQCVGSHSTPHKWLSHKIGSRLPLFVSGLHLAADGQYRTTVFTTEAAFMCEQFAQNHHIKVELPHPNHYTMHATL